MGDYLKLFETDNDRLTYEEGETYIEPYVSYVEEDNSVHYNKKPETRVVAVFNVTSTENETKIGFNVTNVDKIEIDGVLLDGVVNSYTFDTLGEHTIMYTLKDSTDLQNVAYMSCPNLVSISIPESVTTIGSNAFAYCSGLTNITIPSSVTSIGDAAFRSCSSLTTITIPNGVSDILGSTFDGCSGMTSITIPNGITNIGASAFTSCRSLTNVTIPSSVTNIGISAFANCSGLTSVTCLATTPPTLGESAFQGVSGCKYYVPAESVDAYKAAKVWKYNASDIEPIPTT